MMKSIAIQISLYLFSFWLTFLPTVITYGYRVMTGEILYNAAILANCIFTLQGFIMVWVYFSLDKVGKPKPNSLTNASSKVGVRRQLTVKDIRTNAERKGENETDVDSEERISFVFNIFDGVPNEDSPWAKFIDADEFDDIDEAQGATESVPEN
jgi:hypothetical protein